jgi:hypothetical protein
MPKNPGTRRRKAEAPKDLAVRKAGDVVGGTLSARSGIKMDFSDGTSDTSGTSASTTSTTSTTGGPIRTRSGIIMDIEDLAD